jgi:hypothetical protein
MNRPQGAQENWKTPPIPAGMAGNANVDHQIPPQPDKKNPVQWGHAPAPFSLMRRENPSLGDAGRPALA